VDLVEQMLPKIADIPPALRAKKAVPTLGQTRSGFAIRDIEQTQLAMGIRLFGYDNEDRHVLRVLSAVLGENMSSRLFQIVREKHGLAYSVHSSVQLFKESGALVISAGLDRSRREKALDLIVRELARMKERPVGAAERKRAKDYVIGQLQLGLESTLHQMMWVGENITTRGRIITPEEVIAKVSAVTADDVLRLAQKTLRRSRTSLSVISQDLTRKDERALEACLKGL
jgi:predicted Zn-dependent peptidase